MIQKNNMLSTKKKITSIFLTWKIKLGSQPQKQIDLTYSIQIGKLKLMSYFNFILKILIKFTKIKNLTQDVRNQFKIFKNKQR